MRNFRFRIGAKLAISALIGVFVVLAMVGNQARVNRLTRDLADQVQTSETLQKSALSAEIALRQLILTDREIRLVTTPAAIRSILQDLQHHTDEGNRAYDTALNTTIFAEDRLDVESAKEAFNNYSGIAKQMGAAQATIIDLRERQIVEGVEWDQKLDAAINDSPSLSVEDRVPFVRSMRNADSKFKQAQSEFWSRFTRSDENQIKRLYEDLDDAKRLLEIALPNAGSGNIAETVTQLMTTLPRYRSIVDGVTRATEMQTVLQQTSADPLRTAADTRLGELRRSLSQRIDRLTAQSSAELRRAEWINVAAGIFVILVLVGSAAFSSIAIGRPIQHIGEMLTQLSRGNKTVPIPYAQRGDEIGDAARAAQTFKEHLLRMEQLEAQHKEAEARSARQRKAETERFADEFQAAIGTIVETVSSAATHLETTASALAQTADTTHQLSGVVAKAAEDTSSNVESVAISSDELASSVAETGRQVQHSSHITSEAVRQAERTDAQISQLSRAAEHISQVLKLITDIAEQTNLLALNATIEAARAGESGRGFAIVASEVKILANQTAQAAEEIGGQIAGMQAATSDSVSAIKEIGATIRNVSEIATAIASAVDQQGDAMQEIARNIHAASHATTQVVTNIHNVNRGASETGAASAQVLSSAKALADQGKNLKTEAEKFLARVRAG